jgi:hypothetical protein
MHSLLAVLKVWAATEYPQKQVLKSWQELSLDAAWELHTEHPIGVLSRA